ncbi:succinate dehydrogenase, hydrophobic membrane anchor protein [Roseomonas sp. NAR14]|uniref:Succinate dehydrogenase hydrophobic membrane anchor subunit n=1 Tax=Roseomonas acroporae TaxID=2937791 RepID=A0A9X1YA14_9PROT|nr:succinate dehydrogenase, hydrophobic membrane anchor protein [Roseomonas acroporae]MCK8784877.1 succinate dehydrogenase, hydrophobic membrane anchor protein [Roseomonas acroporae]
MATPPVHITRYATPLARVRGFGAAKSGTAHWWHQRITSIALLPLSLWFVFSAAMLAGKPYPVVALWIGHPFNAALLLATIAFSAHHVAAGLQVVVEDYVRNDGAKVAGILAVKGLCIFLALLSALAVLRLVVVRVLV